jgi:hypothetical protein
MINHARTILGSYEAHEPIGFLDGHVWKEDRGEEGQLWNRGLRQRREAPHEVRNRARLRQHLVVGRGNDQQEAPFVR